MIYTVDFVVHSLNNWAQVGGEIPLTATCYQDCGKLRQYEISLLTLLYVLCTNRSRQELRKKNMNTAQRKRD